MVDMSGAPVIVAGLGLFLAAREVVQESGLGGQTGRDDMVQIARLVALDVDLGVPITGLGD